VDPCGSEHRFNFTAQSTDHFKNLVDFLFIFLAQVVISNFSPYFMYIQIAQVERQQSPTLKVVGSNPVNARNLLLWLHRGIYIIFNKINIFAPRE